MSLCFHLSAGSTRLSLPTSPTTPVSVMSSPVEIGPLKSFGDLVYRHSSLPTTCRYDSGSSLRMFDFCSSCSWDSRVPRIVKILCFSYGPVDFVSHFPPCISLGPWSLSSWPTVPSWKSLLHDWTKLKEKRVVRQSTHLLRDVPVANLPLFSQFDSVDTEPSSNKVVVNSRD